MSAISDVKAKVKEAKAMIKNVKGMCAKVKAVVTKVKASGAEIQGFCKAAQADVQKISSISYPPKCKELKAVAKMAKSYKGKIPSLC